MIKWRLFRKKQVDEPIAAEAPTASEPEGRIDFIQRMVDEIKEAQHECEESKFEYGQVTSFLRDIQLIDNAPEDQRLVIRDIADGIQELHSQREKRTENKYKITDAQRSALERYEDIVERDVSKLNEFESYQIKIKNDLRQLSSEKNMLSREKKDIVIRQGFLRRMTKCIGFIVASLYILVIVVNQIFKVEPVMPFIAVSAFALLGLGFVMFESNRNRVDMVVTEKKINKAILLLNKVKIKYVNNTNAVEFMCAKYRVRNGNELEFTYHQYVQIKREMEQQQEGTRLLNEYSKILIHELDKLGVKDKDLWFHQTEALVDDKEMVEVRHGLNEQRQKLRERLEYNSDLMEKNLLALEELRSKGPEYAEEIERVLGKSKM